MRIRGKAFWAWADPTLHHQIHDESLADGTTIDVQSRLSRAGGTQLFIGVYAPSGLVLDEQCFDSRPGQSMTTALSWGVDMALQRAREASSSLSQTADVSDRSKERVEDYVRIQ